MQQYLLSVGLSLAQQRVSVSRAGDEVKASLEGTWEGGRWTEVASLEAWN